MTDEEKQYFAAQLALRFDDLIQWAVTQWPDKDRPLTAAHFERARAEFAALAAGDYAATARECGGARTGTRRRPVHRRHAGAMALSDDAPLHILLNAGSGRNDSATTRQTIAGLLADAGRRHEITLLTDPARLQAMAEEAVRKAKAGGGAVVAAGGDGTINAIAQVAHAAHCPFGVLPQGTFNYFGRTHGIPEDTAEAVRALLAARIQPVQVGLVNDRVFLVNASVGLYPQLLEDREAYKSQYGRSRLVALFAGVATILKQHRQLRITLEYQGRTRSVRTPTLFVGNNALQMQQIGMPPLADALDHGHLGRHHAQADRQRGDAVAARARPAGPARRRRQRRALRAEASDRLPVATVSVAALQGRHRRRITHMRAPLQSASRRAAAVPQTRHNGIARMSVLIQISDRISAPSNRPWSPRCAR
jgi:diacylglycerol kinase family enzyme